MATLNCPVEGFQGEWFDQNNPAYGKHAYQYASTSMNSNEMLPNLILFPKGDDDVIKALAYARKNEVQVAIRTGGHQYCGASSTDGKNIQLDLSQTYLGWDFDRGVREDGTKVPATVTTGISLSLIEFNKLMRQNKLFAPTGQCSNVHLGGHIQTGGYGQLARGFGLLGDHILRLDLITAKGEKKSVYRDAKSAEDRDLFYAMLGGSPGNFGVLTRAKIQVYRDEDYPESRGLRSAYLYDKERLIKLLNLVARVSDQSRSYDLSVTVLSSDWHIFPHCWLTEYDEDLRKEMIDEYMLQYHQQLYGVEGKKHALFPSMIVVFAQWANAGGAGEPYNDDVDAWFAKIEDIGPSILKYNSIKPNVTTPMSELCRNWGFETVREYPLPYEKRAHLLNWSSSQLEERGWAKWLADQIDKVQSQAGGIFEPNTTGCKLSVQIQNFGGGSSMFYKPRLMGMP